MGNSSTTKVVGQGKAILHLFSVKSLTLTEVLHVPDVQKNLVSGLVLINNGFKLVFEYQKLYKMLYLVSPFQDELNSVGNKASTSVYIIISYEVWHAGQVHVNF